MAKKITKSAKGPKSIVLANNDIVYLWWTWPRKIDNCLGFSIRRIVNGKEETKGLPAYVGFDIKLDKRKSPQTTDQWPIQSFNWKDVYAPANKKLKYRIIPMMDTGAGWKQLQPDRKNSIVTATISRTINHGDSRVIFNRGLLSTQAFAKEVKKLKSSGTKLLNGAKGLISKKGSIWRKRLGGAFLENMQDFFKQGKGSGNFFAALYELSDDELLEMLLKSKKLQVILSSSDSNTDSRKQLHKAMKAGKLKVYNRLMSANSIGHNKFVIYTDKNGKPKSVLTGSVNWTPTGLCGQTNNMVIIENEKTAAKYMDYWQKLLADTDKKGKALQGQPLRTWCRDNGVDLKLKPSTDLGLWYSPNTVKKSKPKKITSAAVPVDMKEVYNLIAKAKGQLYYLVFNPGTPSIVDEVRTKALAAKKAGKPIFVRGAVSDAKIGKAVTTNIISKDATLPPDKYKVTPVAAIPGLFSYWEKELLKFGFATIHDKILVVDPFDEKKCAVITGSHNLGFKASYSNDENMLIIRGNSAIAQAYTTHVLDVVNHFKWRYKLQEAVKGKKGAALKKALESGWHDLDEYDKWMNYYYNKNGDLVKEQLLFK